MPRPAPHRVFLQETLRRFQTTGAVLPSGWFLAQALTRFVREDAGRPRRILEVGPGTGAVTRQIVRGMRHDDRLDLVEINPAFVEVLHSRIQHERDFRGAADRICIMCRSVEDLQLEGVYDVIVSGVPLNNFSAPEVISILTAFERLARPGGSLSFFEYIAIRKAKTLVGPREERERLEAVGRVMDNFLTRAAEREPVWLNVPPAWVHHIHFGQRPTTKRKKRRTR